MISGNETKYLHPPQTTLPKEFARISDIAKNLSSLMPTGASTLRAEIKKLPLLSVEILTTERDVRLAMLYYHMIQSAYIHIEDGESVIPKNIAVPSYRLSTKLSYKEYTKPPMLGYFSYILDNYKIKDGSAPFVLENLDPLVTFTGTESEKVFILTHLTPFEYRGVEGLGAVVDMHKAVKTQNTAALIHSLGLLTSCLLEIQKGFTQIETSVSPDTYRDTIRRYLMSFTGVIYDGLKEYRQEPKSFIGASGAQTVTIPAFSLALGIRYKNPKIIESIAGTKKYLHPKDQAFIRFIEDGPNVWEYVKNRRRNNTELVLAYNSCLAALDNFRVSHASFIASYITPQGTDPRGTGNTIIPWWLNAIIEETRAYYL